MRYIGERWHRPCWDAALPRKPGRPSLGAGKGRAGRVLSTRVSLDEAARVDVHCKREGLTSAQLLRSLLVGIIG